MQKQQLLEDNVFTVTLKKHGQGGDFTFGEANTSLVASGHSVRYTSIDTSQGFWTVDSFSAFVGNINSTTMIKRPWNQAVMDTGTCKSSIKNAPIE
jgi:hypothetical protein